MENSLNYISKYIDQVDMKVKSEIVENYINAWGSRFETSPICLKTLYITNIKL